MYHLSAGRRRSQPLAKQAWTIAAPDTQHRIQNDAALAILAANATAPSETMAYFPSYSTCLGRGNHA